jgi:hypothetical protein
MKKIIVLLIVFSSCKKDVILEKLPTPLVEVSNNTISNVVKGYPCADTTNYDVFNGVRFVNTNTYGNKPYGALIVNKNDGYPIYDGNESSRFEVRDGDCGWNDGFSDCQTDRSRSEIYGKDFENYCLNKVVTYIVHVYIPNQSKFRPLGSSNLLVMNQINYSDSSGKVFGALAYLVMEQNNNLIIRTHKDFTWIGLHDYTITNTPFDKWVTLKYEIKMSNNEDGYIKVFVNENLLVYENRPTIPSKTGLINLKLGIYNSFRSFAKESYNTQIIYIDGVSKKIN